MKDIFVILDTHSLIYRSFYGIRELTTKDGKHTNAVYGFSKTLLKIIDTIKPTHFACAIDLPGKTFRHNIYNEYKATRSKAPDELYEQIPYVYEVLDALKIPVIGIESYEADDIAGSLSMNEDILPDSERCIITGDIDYLQLVNENIKVIQYKQGFTTVINYNEEKVKELIGVNSNQIIDFKGLVGDSSDNLPGVKGIGPKTAISLIDKYNNLDGIYNNLDKLKESVREKLITDKEKAYLTKDLATIDTNIPIKINEDDLKLNLDQNMENLIKKFEKFEFNHLVKVYGAGNQKKINSQDNPKQSSLF